MVKSGLTYVIGSIGCAVLFFLRPSAELRFVKWRDSFLVIVVRGAGRVAQGGR